MQQGRRVPLPVPWPCFSSHLSALFVVLCLQTSLISDLFICMMPFWSAGIECYCSALPHSVLQGPHIRAYPREPASKSPAQRGPGQKPVVLVFPSVSVLGSDFADTPRAKLPPMQLLAYLQCQSLAVVPSVLISLAEPHCPMEQRAGGIQLGQRA